MSSAEKAEIQINLLPLKRSLLENCENLISLQNTLSAIPKKGYTTTEAKCRALRAARAEALDRLDEIISSADVKPLDQEYDEHIATANKVIVFPAVA